ncbi:MAG: hypothetical protein ACOX0E_03260 [Syntrophomonadaceae bacterium]|jgi:hypothetical protein
MMDNSTPRPAILVDLKKYRIRIHKNTLRSLGTPNYVLLLVNPEEQSLAILRSDRSDPRAHHITMAIFENNKSSFELYSRSLVKKLRDVCSCWQDSQSYRLYGEVFPLEGMARFYMSEAVLVNGLDS